MADDPTNLKEFYRMFSTSFLCDYATALELDKVRGADQAFCEHRVGLIDEVLLERGATRAVAAPVEKPRRRKRLPHP